MLVTWGGGGGATEVEVRSAYITVLPQAGDAEGLQEVAAAQQEDTQLCSRKDTM